MEEITAAMGDRKFSQSELLDLIMKIQGVSEPTAKDRLEDMKNKKLVWELNDIKHRQKLCYIQTQAFDTFRGYLRDVMHHEIERIYESPHYKKIDLKQSLDIADKFIEVLGPGKITPKKAAEVIDLLLEKFDLVTDALKKIRTQIISQDYAKSDVLHKSAEGSGSDGGNH